MRGEIEREEKCRKRGKIGDREQTERYAFRAERERKHERMIRGGENVYRLVLLLCSCPSWLKKVFFCHQCCPS